ncbi:hypothetical protein BS78_03G244500 [Paspalum vaginatum]|nr:hypothetical protein BS78_03G244500 [Paspalum vaginatum]
MILYLTYFAYPGSGTDTGQADYNAVPFSYGSASGSDDPNSLGSYYRPSFHVPESLLNKLPHSEKAHQIIARTALFVSEHGGQSEIVLRVKQGNNPTFGFLMPDHHLHSYYRYLVDHPQLLKDGADAVDTNKGDKTVTGDSEQPSSGGALSLLGTAYDSGDEDEDSLPSRSKGMNTGISMMPDVQGHVKPTSILPDNKESQKDQIMSTAAGVADNSKIILTKNPILTGNNIVAAQREKVKDTVTASTTGKSQNTNSGLSETKEMILEPPSFMKRTMEKIVEFILTNGKEFEQKLIEQDRTTGRFPFLLPYNPYHSYYHKFLQETQESGSHGRSPDHKERRSSSDRRGRRSPSERDDRSSRERDDRRSSRERYDRRSSRERDDRRSSMERKDCRYGNEGTRSHAWLTAGVSSPSDRSSAGPSEKQLYDQEGKGGFYPVSGARREPPRKVTADEAAAIVMAATRGLSAANDSHDTAKGIKDNVHARGSNDHSSSFGSFSSLLGRDAPSKRISNSEADTSVTSSGQPKNEGFGIIDDDWIANTIAKAAAVAASKEADSSEASMTKEQKLKAERLRRAKMFAAIIKSGAGGNKTNDLAAASDPTNELAKEDPADINVSGIDPQPLAKEREGSSAPFEREGSNVTKLEKDSDDEQNRVRKYRKKHQQESDEEKDESVENYTHSRKRHRSEHSRGHSKDVRKHKRKSHSKDRESRHHSHHHISSEDEHGHRSSKSRHRQRDDDRNTDDEERTRARKHRREHRSSSKRKQEEDQDQSEQSQGLLEASPSTSGAKFEDKPPGGTPQSSQGTTEVPSDLRAKIRAMLLERM